MKHAIFAGALGLVVAAAGSVSAQDVSGAVRAAAVDAEMKAMDTNGDGRLSAEEHAAATAKMFRGMDANSDGRVTAAEMEAAHARITGGKPLKGEMSAADKIKTIDTDGDGVLSAEEHRAGSQKMFEAQDRNKDGYLSKNELAAGQAMKMRKVPQ